MNAQVRVQGTWILSILFIVWSVASLATYLFFIMMLGYSLKVSPDTIWWLIGGTVAILVLPACVIAAGFYLWLETRFPWLAIGPALIAVAGISFVGWRAFLA